MIFGDHPVVEHRLRNGYEPYSPSPAEIQKGIEIPSNGFKLHIDDDYQLGRLIHQAMQLLELVKQDNLDDDGFAITTLAAVFSGLQEKIHAQQIALVQNRTEIDSAKSEASELQQENQLLKEQLAKANYELYGASSEQTPKNLAKAEADAASESEDLPETAKAEPKRNGGRKGLAKHIPRVEEFCPAKPAEKICAGCNSVMAFVGNEFTERLEMMPAKAFVRKYITEKYICRCGCNTSFQSKAPRSVIPGSSYGSASVIAEILTNKFQFAIPLYRQTQFFAKAGVPMNRSTLANLVIQMGQRLKPLWDAYRRHLLMHAVIHADETTMQVLKEPNRAPQTKSYMWQYCSGQSAAHPLVLFDYQETRSGTHALNFLTGDDGSVFNGYLQVDGYSGYNTVTGPTRMGCMAHVRRKFVEALRSVPAQARHLSKANEAVTLIQELYVIEAQIKGYASERRLKIRKAQSQPILDEFKRWLDECSETTPPKSLMGKAVNYALGQWNYLAHYAKNGDLSIDNNIAERSIKAFVIGRKNWLFADTVAGAKANAVISSIVRSAVMNELDPYQYLMAILEKLPEVHTPEDFEAMLPWVVKCQLDAGMVAPARMVA